LKARSLLRTAEETKKRHLSEKSSLEAKIVELEKNKSSEVCCLNISCFAFSARKVVNLSHTGIRALPSSINSLCQLWSLILQNCNELKELPDIGNLCHLQLLDCAYDMPVLDQLLLMRYCLHLIWRVVCQQEVDCEQEEFWWIKITTHREFLWFHIQLLSLFKLNQCSWSGLIREKESLQEAGNCLKSLFHKIIPGD